MNIVKYIGNIAFNCMVNGTIMRHVNHNHRYIKFFSCTTPRILVVKKIGMRNKIPLVEKSYYFYCEFPGDRKYHIPHSAIDDDAVKQVSFMEKEELKRLACELETAESKVVFSVLMKLYAPIIIIATLLYCTGVVLSILRDFGFWKTFIYLVSVTICFILAMQTAYTVVDKVKNNIREIIRTWET